MPAPKLAPKPDDTAAPEAPPPSKPKNLAAALLEAQKAVGRVAKGSTNEYDHYSYTSADEMVLAVRIALHDAGLLLSRIGSRIEQPLREGEPLELVSLFKLEYPETGEERNYEFAWPIVGNPKRLYATDKARAGALTTSLGYFERDLLNISRQDSNEMDKRVDQDAAPPPAKPSDESRTLQADIASGIGLLRDKAQVKTAGTYLDRAGHDLKLLRQVQSWVGKKVAEQKAAAAADAGSTYDPAPGEGAWAKAAAAANPAKPDEPTLVDPETGEVLDPESPFFGERGNDGP